jgi:hypothetical protein
MTSLCPLLPPLCSPYKKRLIYRCCGSRMLASMPNIAQPPLFIWSLCPLMICTPRLNLAPLSSHFAARFFYPSSLSTQLHPSLVTAYFENVP